MAHGAEGPERAVQTDAGGEPSLGEDAATLSKLVGEPVVLRMVK